MTVGDLIKQYPKAAEQLYSQAFDDGVACEREAWEKRVLSFEETGRVADEMFREVFAPEHCEPEDPEDSKI